MDTEKFRLLLEEERARKLALLPALRADIASANAARHNSNVDDEHDPEGATIAFELSQASALLDQSRSGLAEVDAALERIDAGTYGICTVCGEQIAEGRLEARPWTPSASATRVAGPNPGSAAEDAAELFRRREERRTLGLGGDCHAGNPGRPHHHPGQDSGVH
jgi:DnaK suppressor protein